MRGSTDTAPLKATEVFTGMSNTPAGPCAFLDLTPTSVNGAEAVGVTLTKGDGALVPTRFVAVIVHVRATSFVSPTIRMGDDVPVTVIAPILQSTVKLVIGALLSENAVKLNMALALPGTALGDDGAFGTVLNIAVTLLVASMVTSHVPDPAHAPDQPAKPLPVTAVAVSVTRAPLAKFAVQVLPQDMPAGADVTVPVPVPLFATVKLLGPSVVVGNTALRPPIVSVVFTRPFGIDAVV